MVSKNAFLIMVSQKSLKRSELPSRIERSRNKTVFNDLVDPFESKKIETDGSDTQGKHFISNRRDALWFIDGHHSTFERLHVRQTDPEVAQKQAHYGSN